MEIYFSLSSTATLHLLGVTEIRTELRTWQKGRDSLHVSRYSAESLENGEKVGGKLTEKADHEVVGIVPLNRRYLVVFQRNHGC